MASYKYTLAGQASFSHELSITCVRKFFKQFGSLKNLRLAANSFRFISTFGTKIINQ